MEKYSRLQDPGTHLLRLLGIRGQTIKSFISKLHALAKVYGSDMDKPQLILKRKFCKLLSTFWSKKKYLGPVIWARPEQILVSIVGDGSQLKLQCKTSGFPTPQYQWFEEDRLLEGVSTSSIVISRLASRVFEIKLTTTYFSDVPARLEMFSGVKFGMLLKIAKNGLHFIARMAKFIIQSWFQILSIYLHLHLLIKVRIPR